MQLPLQFEEYKPLKEYSTFGIGGPARYFVEVKSIDEIVLLLPFLKSEKLPYFVLGKGSNLLFDDRGFNGVVIYNKITHYEKEGSVITVGAGYSFALLGTRTAREQLSGLEFASGIPGSVGGAVYMNAGIGSECTEKPLVSVLFVTEEGGIEPLKKENLAFGYRTSPFQSRKGVIAEATFQLIPSQEAKQKVQTLVDYRCSTQPVKAKSAGCVFRNPPGGVSAGALIDQCGLKGMRIGDAEVSPIHANFIINRGSASAQDVLTLAEMVREKVNEKRGVLLEKEIRVIPYCE